MKKSRLLQVFLCHAKDDEPFVKNIYQTLINNGIDAWLDTEKLLPGQDWKTEIPKAIEDTDVVLVLLSNKSIEKRGYVQKEIRVALDAAELIPFGKIFIIPARLEDCEVPSPLKKYQWVNLFESNGYEKLWKTLAHCSESLGIQLSKYPFGAWQPKDNGEENKFLFNGSPFMPNIDDRIVESIIDAINVDQSYYPGEAVAQHVSLFSTMHVKKVADELSAINYIFGINADIEDVKTYAHGLYRPMRVLATSYFSITSGRDKVIEKLMEMGYSDGSIGEENFVMGNLSRGEKWLTQNLRSGEVVVSEIVKQEKWSSDSLYYKIGLEASRRTFHNYLDRVLKHFGNSIINHGTV